jgi:hypothetical protein
MTLPSWLRWVFSGAAVFAMLLWLEDIIAPFAALGVIYLMTYHWDKHP